MINDFASAAQTLYNKKDEQKKRIPEAGQKPRAKQKQQQKQQEKQDKQQQVASGSLSGSKAMGSSDATSSAAVRAHAYSCRQPRSTSREGTSCSQVTRSRSLHRAPHSDLHIGQQQPLLDTPQQQRPQKRQLCILKPAFEATDYRRKWPRVRAMSAIQSSRQTGHSLEIACARVRVLVECRQREAALISTTVALQRKRSETQRPPPPLPLPPKRAAAPARMSRAGSLGSIC